MFLDTSQPSDGDYLQRIGRIYETLHRVQAESAPGLDIYLLEADLNTGDSALSIVQANLSRHAQMLNTRNLQMFQILITDVQADLEQQMMIPKQYSEKLTGLQTDLSAIRKDSLLMRMVRDTALRKSYLPQLMEMRRKWVQADSAIKANIAVVHKLESRVARSAILAAELKSQVSGYMSKIGIQAFGKEVNFLWEPSPKMEKDEAVREAFRQSWQGNQKAVGYYFDNNSQTRWWGFFLGLVFFLWIYRNLRHLRKYGQKPENFTYLQAFPLVATIVFILNLAPVFDLHPPAAYIESIQFLLMVALTFLFWRRWSWRMLAYWGGVWALFLLFSVTQTFLTPDFGQRIWLLTLNIGAVLFGLLFLFRARKELSLPGFVRSVLFIFIFLNVLSILTNVYGRFSLARIFASTAIFGLAQSIGLAAFIQIGVEAFLLQVQRGRLDSGLKGAFDQQEVETRVRRLWTAIALILLAMVFAANLNIYSALYNGIAGFLNRPRQIGNTTFQFGSVAIFFLIVWIANLLQRYTGYFFGDTDEEFAEENKAKRSRLLIWRLVLLSAGFLLAVAASGLPVDKLTIVLGALGVGIGLGLQNIVNNLVSGVILIFERPLQMGDTIEVGNLKGKVKGIGIRSSKLLTPEGAEVIIPNGDLLSQHIVNWTLSDNHVRVEMPLSISAGHDFVATEALIVETLSAHPQVLKKYKPVVIADKIGAAGMVLTAQFWCTDINKVEMIKSELRMLLGERLGDKGLSIG